MNDGAAGVALLGLGTIGTGVARLLTAEPTRIARRAGRPVRIVGALVRDAGRPRGPFAQDVPVTTDARRLIEDERVSLVVEALGGTEPSRTLVLEALAAGKDVVTANKALLAEHGVEIFGEARRLGRALAFEGSVAGGVPIVQALGVGLAANEILSISAIVNGTCNFILTSMTRDGVGYADALAEAQRLGYAEPDPTFDVDGTDAAHKLAILAQLGFGANVAMSSIPRTGIDGVPAADLRYAGELGYAVKLLAQAKRTEAGLELQVAPRLVRHGTPLADVSGPYNAIRVVGDVVGDTLFYGRGAGAMPTASAVVGDIIDVVLGRAAITFRALGLWREDGVRSMPAPPAAIKSRYYVRFTIADRPGVIGAIAQALGGRRISIASVIQHDPGDDAPPGSPVPLVIMTHAAVQADVAAALAEIDRLDVVHPPSICLGVED